jgi:AcrR family transcriptional regulator
VVELRQGVSYGGLTRETRLPEPPTQARGVEKRERIYRAAIDRYRADGVAATRVEDVIADADVSWATFFRYFPRKEDVLIEAAARHFRDHIAPVATRGIRDRRLRVRTVTERTLEAVLTPAEMTPPLHTEAVLEVFARPVRFAAMVDSGQPQPIIGLVAELIGEAQRRGEVRDDVDAGAAAVTVAAGALFPAVQTASVGTDPLPSLRSAIEIVWRGLGHRAPAHGARASSLT